MTAVAGATGLYQPVKDPHALGHGGGTDTNGHGAGGPAPRRVVVSFGFWIFLLSDIVMFSAFFAAYAVLKVDLAGGPDGAQLFDIHNAAIETVLLLFSSFTCGMAALGLNARSVAATQICLAVTALLGLGFLGLELSEFARMIAEGAGPQRSAFLSAFFALVGCHGLHVALGLIWLCIMMVQVATLGFTDAVVRRLTCFSLFWHALDIIWVALLTIVYLMGGSL